jgi:hypothetical protein
MGKGSRNKRLKRSVKKHSVDILRTYINEIKAFKFSPRISIAWSIVKGKRWQAEILRYTFAIMFLLACYGLYSISCEFVDWHKLIQSMQ